MLIVTGILVGSSMITRQNMLPPVGVFVTTTVVRYTIRCDETSLTRLSMDFILGAMLVNLH